MMRYVLKNIHALVKNEKFIFAVMLVCVFASAWVMTFSYGLYHNYQEMLNQSEDDPDNNLLFSDLAEGETLTRGEVTQFLLEISPDTMNAIAFVNVVCYSNEGYEDVYGHNPDYNKLFLVSDFIVRDGEFVTSPYILQEWEEHNSIIGGRFISDFEESNGEKVVIAVEKVGADGFSERERYPDLYKDDETILIDGEEFKIVGMNAGSYIVPFLALPEDLVIQTPSFYFYGTITPQQYNDIVDTAERVLPGKFIFPEIEFVDEQSIMIYNNMLVVAALIAVITIINFAFLYSFILRKRSRTLAIMRICGCTKGKVRLICLGECCLICIPTFIVGVLTYIPFLHNVLGRLFDYIEEAYSLVVYGLLFAVFAAVLLLVMWILLSRQIRRELAEARKGGAV